ncbi:MAG: hypothetical protein A2505_06465 [Deltaproteobacteria bacterium RIFOXYD12_FULL_55_16]|nr:MAG: hypothetical protein A2505_06465 [Deltaproteobacteria bacterium RIFOXYD12_FULL_55_16]
MTRLIFLLMIVLLSGPAVSAEAEPIGRLFFRAAERAQFDQLRNDNALENARAGRPAQTEKFSLNGLVRRSGGKTTAWVNQMPQRENEKQEVTVLKSPARSPFIPLKLPSGKQVRLKPGQTFDTLSGKVREGYETPVPPLPAEDSK